MNKSHLLYVFNHVISKGDCCDGKYYLGELVAWHDYDGYTCFIGYKDLTLTLFFHNRLSYDYAEKETLNAFKVLVTTLIVHLNPG